MAVFVKGVVRPNKSGDKSRRFNIDLCCGALVEGDHRNDKALHLNPRFDAGFALWPFAKPDNEIVLNTLTDNTWGVEQRCENPLESDQAFYVRILILADYFKVFRLFLRRS